MCLKVEIALALSKRFVITIRVSIYRREFLRRRYVEIKEKKKKYKKEKSEIRLHGRNFCPLKFESRAREEESQS